MDMYGLELILLRLCWVGWILPSRHWLMKAEVALEREVEGDLFLQDIGQGFGFRPGTFDGAIRYITME
jgi:hypothetical protein